MVYGVQSISRLGTEIIRTFCASEDGVFIDLRSSLVTEFGWSAVHWENGTEIQRDGHLCVQERRHYTNTYIPNNREVRATQAQTAGAIDSSPLAALSIRNVRVYQQERVQGPDTKSDLRAFEGRSFISRVS